jgi:hypothetical protein
MLGLAGQALARMRERRAQCRKTMNSGMAINALLRGGR